MHNQNFEILKKLIALIAVFIAVFIVAFAFGRVLGGFVRGEDMSQLKIVRYVKGQDLNSKYDKKEMESWELNPQNPKSLILAGDSESKPQPYKLREKLSLKEPEAIQYLRDVATGKEKSEIAKNNIEVFNNFNAENKVAITFDDGPLPDWTEKYMDVLEAHDVKATFFILGQYVERNPDACRRIIDGGSEIGSHSLWHGRLAKMNNTDLMADFEQCQSIVLEKTGVNMAMMRPPYGEKNEAIINACKNYEQLIILWNIDSLDWKAKSSDQIYNNVMNNLTGKGDIILFHEGKDLTLKALPRIIKEIKAKGYEIVPVSELIYNN